MAVRDSGTSARRIVIKVGSSTLASPHGGVDRDYVRSLVLQINTLKEMGWRPVIVSSGAIAAGVEELGLTSRPADMPTLQAAASIGQVSVLSLYAAFFAAHGTRIGQILLTRRDTAHRQSYLHARDTFERLIELGVVPVVNENDTVAVEEIRFGDNDTLAALVAVMIGADMVVFLTDIEGLYSADPRDDESAELLDRVTQVTDQMMAAAGPAGSAIGSGGMSTKVRAAKVLMRAGIPLVVCDGRRDRVVLDAAEGNPVGTFFVQGQESISAKKLWIATASNPCGEVVIDAGAKEALLGQGRSLLPAGVVGVSGVFDVGDTIVLLDTEGKMVGQGLAGISAVDLDAIKGLNSTQISKVRPGVAGREVVHRDHLVIL